MRWLCQDCGTVTADQDLLRAPSPFDPETEMTGCPECKSHDALVAACEVCGKRACGGRSMGFTRCCAGSISGRKKPRTVASAGSTLRLPECRQPCRRGPVPGDSTIRLSLRPVNHARRPELASLSASN